MNIVWKVKVGTETYSSPVVAGGKVFIGTNNGARLNPTHPKEKDMSCLVCFDEATGLFLWQYASEKLSGVDSQHDLREIGLCSTACIDGDRVWVVTNRCEVVCLDANGFRDGENDGPFCHERSVTEIDGDVVWKYDLFGELGVRPLHQSVSNVTVVDGMLLFNTSNGPDNSYLKVPASDAPHFVALDAATGRLIWKDNSAGESIVIGGSSAGCPGASPAVAILAGVAQAVFTGSEGWVYAFSFDDLKSGITTLLWKFDCNPKTAAGRRRGRRNTLMGSPVVADGLVYVATGRDPEFGDGPADLWCIDPSKRGDLSSELVFNNAYANGLKPIPFKPFCACETFKGDFVRPNPNSGAIWHFASADLDNNGEIEFEETFHRSLGSPVIHDGLLFISDAAGMLFCLDSSTGEVQWTHDMMVSVRGSCVVGNGHVLIGNENGDIEIFKAGRTKQSVLSDVPRNLGGPIYGTAAAVGGTLFIASADLLVAIRDKAKSSRSQ
jgi:outer membrane protein assembly factor BamB